MISTFLKRILGAILIMGIIGVVCHSILWLFIMISNHTGINYFTLLASSEYSAGRLVMLVFGLIGGFTFLASSDLRKKDPIE